MASDHEVDYCFDSTEPFFENVPPYQDYVHLLNEAQITYPNLHIPSGNGQTDIGRMQSLVQGVLYARILFAIYYATKLPSWTRGAMQAFIDIQWRAMESTDPFEFLKTHPLMDYCIGEMQYEPQQTLTEHILEQGPQEWTLQQMPNIASQLFHLLNPEATHDKLTLLRYALPMHSLRHFQRYALDHLNEKHVSVCQLIATIYHFGITGQYEQQKTMQMQPFCKSVAKMVQWVQTQPSMLRLYTLSFLDYQLRHVPPLLQTLQQMLPWADWMCRCRQMYAEPGKDLFTILAKPVDTLLQLRSAIGKNSARSRHGASYRLIRSRVLTHRDAPAYEMVAQRWCPESALPISHQMMHMLGINSEEKREAYGLALQRQYCKRWTFLERDPAFCLAQRLAVCRKFEHDHPYRIHDSAASIILNDHRNTIKTYLSNMQSVHRFGAVYTCLKRAHDLDGPFEYVDEQRQSRRSTSWPYPQRLTQHCMFSRMLRLFHYKADKQHRKNTASHTQAIKHHCLLLITPCCGNLCIYDHTSWDCFGVYQCKYCAKYVAV